jgi:hypothetical protein
MFEEAGNAEPAQFAFCFRVALALLESFEIGERQRLVQDFGKFAAVEGGADRCLEGSRSRNEISLWISTGRCR